MELAKDDFIYYGKLIWDFYKINKNATPNLTSIESYVFKFLLACVILSIIMSKLVKKKKDSEEKKMDRENVAVPVV